MIMNAKMDLDLYKGWADMLNSEVLFAVLHNGVDADAAENTPIEEQQTHGRYFGQSRTHELPASLSGSHGIEQLVRASSLAQLETLSHACLRCHPWIRPSANSPHFVGDAQLESR